jgi:hypothetical protein
MSADYDKIAKLEKAISEKYGKETVGNPKGNWSSEKEKEHVKQTKAFYEKIEKNLEKNEKEEVKGALVSKKLLLKKSDRLCPVCTKYSFNRKDDLYMNRFQCCYECYIEYVEGREERWNSGWQPQID